MEQALEEKIAGRLTPQLERLVETVEGLRQDRSTDASQMIERVLGRFADAMQERTGSQFDEMASIVTDLNRTLKNAAESMAQSQQDVRAALDSDMTTVRKSMDAGAASMTETLQQSLGDVTRVLARNVRLIDRHQLHLLRSFLHQDRSSCSPQTAERWRRRSTTL